MESQDTCFFSRRLETLICTYLSWLCEACRSNVKLFGSSHVLTLVLGSVSSLEHFHYVSDSSRLNQIRNILARLMSRYLCLVQCLCLRKKWLDSITDNCILQADFSTRLHILVDMSQYAKFDGNLLTNFTFIVKTHLAYFSLTRYIKVSRVIFFFWIIIRLWIYLSTFICTTQHQRQVTS